jgi:hypothetical protein
MRNAVRCHLLSIIESNTQHLLDSLGTGEHVAAAREVLSQPLDIQKSRRCYGDAEGRANTGRRKSGTGLIDNAHGQPGDSASNAINVPSGELGPIFLRTGEQQFDDTLTVTANGLVADGMLASQNLAYDLNVSAQTSLQSHPQTVFSIEDDMSALASGLLSTIGASSSLRVPSYVQEVHSTESPEDGPPPKRPRLSGEEEQRVCAREEEQRVRAAARLNFMLDQPQPPFDRIAMNTIPAQDDYFPFDYNLNQTLTLAIDDLGGCSQEHILLAGSAQPPYVQDYDMEKEVEMGDIDALFNEEDEFSERICDVED